VRLRRSRRQFLCLLDLLSHAVLPWLVPEVAMTGSKLGAECKLLSLVVSKLFLLDWCPLLGYRATHIAWLHGS